MTLDAPLDGPPDAGPPPEPIALEDYCAEVLDARCDDVERCGCGAPAVERCRSEVSFGECLGDALHPEMQAAVDEGRLLYDPFAAGRHVDRLRSEPTWCGSGPNPRPTTMREAFTDYFTGFAGTLEPGSTCVVGEALAMPAGCRSGYCMNEICVELADVGEVCVDWSRVCFDLDAPIDDRAPIARCVTSPGAASGICERYLAPNSACASDEECASGTCRFGVCARLAVGRPCDRNAQCESDRCLRDPPGSAGTCLAEGDAADGVACGSNDECASMACVGGICLARACVSFVGEPPPPPVP